MRPSSPTTYLAIVLTLCFTAVTVCSASPTEMPGASTKTPSGCHGHHAPMPPSTHTCCSASYQVPAAAPIAFTPLLHLVGRQQLNAALDAEPQLGLSATSDGNDSSPPLITVLRI